MAVFAVLGVLIGITLSCMEVKRRREYRKKLLHEYQSHMEDGTAERYLSGLIKHKAQWVKSFSLVRKPFNKEINFVLETAALLLATLALTTSVIHFDIRFNGVLEGILVLVLLGIVIGFILSDWVLGRRVDKEIDAVMNAMDEAIQKGELKQFMAEARRDWNPEGEGTTSGRSGA